MKLKPCPNCKSVDLKNTGIGIRCDICLMEGPKTNGGVHDGHNDYIDRQMAVESWNNLPRKK